MDVSLILVGIAATLGGLASAILGWLDSQEPFNSRKFIKSLIVSLIAGVGISIGYSFSDGATVRDFFLAFLSGAGFDVLTNRAWLGRI